MKTAKDIWAAGYVTVAAASEALTRGGDPINPSSLSKYLTRNPHVPQMRQGKYRYVLLASLVEDRNRSIYVAEKRDARGVVRPSFRIPLPEEPLRSGIEAPAPAPLPLDEVAEIENSESQGGSAIEKLHRVRLERQQIDLRRAQRDEAIEDGRLVPAKDVQAVLTAFTEAIKGELARQEMAIQTRMGREVAVEVRKANRQALLAASRRLVAAAQEHLKPAAATSVAIDGAGEPVAA